MILVADVGNTETTLGVYEGETLRGHWRIMTDVPRTADEYGLLLRQLLIDDGINPTHVNGAAVASVVPRVTLPLVAACRRWLSDKPVHLIDGTSKLPIRLDVEEPRTVGADRIANTLAASRLFGRDAIVVDMGTATTASMGSTVPYSVVPSTATTASTGSRRARQSASACCSASASSRMPRSGSSRNWSRPSPSSFKPLLQE